MDKFVTPEVVANIAARQAFSPYNYDDAEYALAGRFGPLDAATLAICRRTVSDFWGGRR